MGKKSRGYNAFVATVLENLVMGLNNDKIESVDKFKLWKAFFIRKLNLLKFFCEQYYVALYILQNYCTVKKKFYSIFFCEQFFFAHNFLQYRFYGKNLKSLRTKFRDLNYQTVRLKFFRLIWNSTCPRKLYLQNL